MKKFKNYINENIYSNVSFDTISSLITNGNMNLVRDFLNTDKENVNFKSDMSETLLMVSLKSKTPDMFYLILEYNPDLKTIEFYDGDTILHKIIKEYIKVYKLGITDAIEQVIKREPELLNIKNHINFSPLETAPLYSVYALLELLKYDPDWGDYSFLDNISAHAKKELLYAYPDKAREYKKFLQVKKFKI